MKTIQSLNKVRRFVLVAGMTAAILLVAGGVLNTIARAAGTPVLVITPNTGPWHTYVVLSGHNFGSNEVVNIKWKSGTRLAGDCPTNAAGSFVCVTPVQINGPGPVNGVFPFTAVGETSGLKTTADFTVN
jgi:hypothetical protein